ncbi:uncharacterized protein [Haliotis cracherodii]|uniref:uncharacterized protein LOC124132725 n=1 Tax=Haliotis rufescens TaxID=6454 RepID=UPI001EAFE29A|nr:uncharacterized protein LOC124132725 [Haliotis rufescens]
MRVVLCLLVGVQCYLASAQQQSVAQQCLTEQVRANQNNFGTTQANGRRQARTRNNAQTATLNAFRAICQNFESYIRCFETRLRGSTVANDNFLNLIFNADDMRAAYRGLCGDLPRLEDNIRCLLTTPQVQRCYDNFRQSVVQVVNIGRQGRLNQGDLENVACNVSVARYQCETQVYSFCNSQAGEIMRSFFFAGLPNRCRRNTGVTSRYSAMFGRLNGAEISHVSAIMMLLPIGALLKIYL